jgi:hypothetical protein
MSTYTVSCAIYTIHAKVEAEEVDAITAALSRWDDDALEIFSGGTFSVQREADEDAA